MNLSWLSGHEVSQTAALLNHLSGSAQRDAGGWGQTGFYCLGPELGQLEGSGSWRSLALWLGCHCWPEADSKALDAAGTGEALTGCFPCVLPLLKNVHSNPTLTRSSTLSLTHQLLKPHWARASSAKTRGFHTQLDEGPETP